MEAQYLGNRAGEQREMIWKCSRNSGRGNRKNAGNVGRGEGWGNKKGASEERCQKDRKNWKEKIR